MDETSRPSRSAMSAAVAARLVPLDEAIPELRETATPKAPASGGPRGSPDPALDAEPVAAYASAYA